MFVQMFYKNILRLSSQWQL